MGSAAEFVDSHAHLDFPELAREEAALLARAWAAGLRHIVTIGLLRRAPPGAPPERDGAAAAIALAEREPRVWATVGIHPHDADLGLPWEGAADAPVTGAYRARWEARLEESLAHLDALSRHPRVVAVGEVGLDFHYDRSPRELQRVVLRRFVRLARERALPLVIHARAAEAEVAAILLEEGAADVGGVIHCYSGDEGLGEAALALGFSFGLTGILTFPRAAALRAQVARLPLERLLIETDCPYLAPLPHRGKRNEPAFVVEVARRLADLLGADLAEVAAATTANARRLFGIEHESDPGEAR
jgi:TatD DNase family protein